MRILAAALLCAVTLTPSMPAYAGDTKEAKPPKPKKICKSETLTSSRMPKRTCKTQEQWDAEALRKDGQDIKLKADQT
ncbi:MAG: hypothetical protein H6918_09150 [Sphingomonadaceae bacterium]|nr:hypothetical protein [Sphingomonadaceae bacterium]